MKLSLSSILVFSLVTPFIMTYSISPNETRYWQFGLIFICLILFIFLDIMKLSQNIYYRIKNFLLWAIIILSIGGAFLSTIIVRHQIAPIFQVHDIILQQEAAIRFLLDGKNPYSSTYFDTPLVDWHYSDTDVNPALYHFVMQPFYIIFALPFYFLLNPLLGFFDARIPLYFLFFVFLILGSFLVKDQEKKLLFLTLLAFNPAQLLYTLEGRSDVFMFTFLFTGLYLLYKNRYSLAGISIALAFAIKQSVWPILPFYIAYLYFRTKNYKHTIQSLVSFIIVFTVVVSPFFFWDQKAFVDSTINYLSGSVEHSYPISGYGFGALLHQFGFIQDLKIYYPFIIWQIIFSFPLLVYLILFLKKSPSVQRLLISYGIFLFVFWYFSRYFNNSHLGFLSMIFISAHFWPHEEKT